MPGQVTRLLFVSNGDKRTIIFRSLDILIIMNDSSLAFPILEKHTVPAFIGADTYWSSRRRIAVIIWETIDTVAAEFSPRAIIHSARLARRTSKAERREV